MRDLKNKTTGHMKVTRKCKRASKIRYVRKGSITRIRMDSIHLLDVVMAGPGESPEGWNPWLPSI